VRKHEKDAVSNPTLAAKPKTKSGFAARMGHPRVWEGQKEELQSDYLSLEMPS
jgi:hypothetical protein